MISDCVRASGVVQFFNSSGQLVHSSNTVLSLGKEWIAQRCTGELTSVVSYIAVGVGSTPVTIADSGLVSEVGRAAVTTPGAVRPTEKSVIRYEASFSAGVGVGALREAGLFTDGDGTCVARTVFPVKTKGEYDVFTIVWEITIN